MEDFFDEVNRVVAQKPIEVLYKRSNSKHRDISRLDKQIMEDIDKNTIHIQIEKY